MWGCRNPVWSPGKGSDTPGYVSAVSQFIVWSLANLYPIFLYHGSPLIAKSNNTFPNYLNFTWQTKGLRHHPSPLCLLKGITNRFRACGQLLPQKASKRKGWPALQGSPIYNLSTQESRGQPGLHRQILSERRIMGVWHGDSKTLTFPRVLGPAGPRSSTSNGRKQL